MSYTQQGAQAGAAFGPWGAAVGTVAGFALDYDKSSGQGGPGAPTAAGGDFMGGSAAVDAYGTGLDGSGWVVNFGTGQAAATESTKAYNKPQAQAVAEAEAQSQGPMAWALPLLIIGAAVLLLARRRKG